MILSSRLWKKRSGKGAGRGKARERGKEKRVKIAEVSATDRSDTSENMAFMLCIFFFPKDVDAYGCVILCAFGEVCLRAYATRSSPSLWVFIGCRYSAVLDLPKNVFMRILEKKTERF